MRTQSRCRRDRRARRRSDAYPGRGLTFLNNRHYNPTTGTFVSVDPLVTMTGQPYIYGNANPVRYSDPEGLCPTSGCWEQFERVFRELSGKAAPGSARSRERELLAKRVNAIAGNAGKTHKSGGTWYSTKETDWARETINCWVRCYQPAPVNNVQLALFVGGFVPYVGEAIDLVDCGRGNKISCGALVVPFVGGRAVDAGRGLSRAGDAGRGIARTCFNSFSASTGVLMADGSTKPISQIEVGDFVLAENPETGERGARQVTHLWVHRDDLVDLVTNAGSITTTEDHPFWNESDREWQWAIDIDPGEHLLTDSGGEIEVQGIDPATAEIGWAYNLSIAGIHTYYVAVEGAAVLVHNTDCSDGIHGMNRAAARSVDVDDVVQNGDIFQQVDGRRVYVSSNGNGTYSTVILDGASTSDQIVTVIEATTESELGSNVGSGRWTPVGDL